MDNKTKILINQYVSGQENAAVNLKNCYEFKIRNAGAIDFTYRLKNNPPVVLPPGVTDSFLSPPQSFFEDTEISFDLTGVNQKVVVISICKNE